MLATVECLVDSVNNAWEILRRQEATRPAQHPLPSLMRTPSQQTVTTSDPPPYSFPDNPSSDAAGGAGVPSANVDPLQQQQPAPGSDNIPDGEPMLPPQQPTTSSSPSPAGGGGASHTPSRVIDGIEEVLSGRPTPRVVGVAGLSASGGGGAGSTTGLLINTSRPGSSRGGGGSGRLASGPTSPLSIQTPNPPQQNTWQMATNAEVALYDAAEALCIQISGVDYRRLARESNRAVELLLVMIQEELHLAMSGSHVPSYLVARQADRFRRLFEETKILLEKRGLAVPAGILRLAAQPSLSSGAADDQDDAQGGDASSSQGRRQSSNANHLHHSGHPHHSHGPSSHQQHGSVPNAATTTRARSVSVDASAEGGGKVQRGAPTSSNSSVGSTSPGHGARSPNTPFYPAADERYDVRLMDAAFGASNAVVRELEDENTALRAKLELLHSEKRELVTTCERQDQTIQGLRAKLHREAEAMSVAQQQMQRDLLELVSQIEAQEQEKELSHPHPHQPHDRLLSPDEEESSRCEGDEDAISICPPSTTSRSENGASAPSSRRPTVEPSRPATAPQGSLLLLPEHAAQIPGASSSIIEDRPRPTTSDANSTGLHKHPLPQQRAVTTASSWLSADDTLDRLYREFYRGRGLDMVLQALELIYRQEFDLSASRSCGPLSQHSQDAPAAVTTVVPSSSAAHSTGGESSTIPFDAFRAHVNGTLQRALESFEMLQESISSQSTPLRSEYIASCVRQRCKPNSGVVQLLSSFQYDRDVTHLDLGGNYLGDNGVVAFLPVLRRLYRLRSLSLRDNGLKNTGVRALLNELQHQSRATTGTSGSGLSQLKELDLRGNPISRTGARELLAFVAATPSLVKLDLEGTSIDPPMLAKIEQRLAQKRVPLSSASSPSPQAQERSPREVPQDQE